MTCRRAFTMVEMMLAVAIGSIVVAIAMSMFVALDRAQDRLERRFEASLGLGRARLATSRAMEQLLVSDSQRPAELDDPENLEELLADGGASLGGGERPRFILEPDIGLPLMQWQPNPQEPGQLIQPQRLELTLRSAPVYAFASGGDSLALDDAAALDDLIESMRAVTPRRAPRAALAGDTGETGDIGEQDEDAGDTGEDEDQDEDEPTEEELEAELRQAPIAPGIRGVFEVTPDENRDPEAPISWTLWWGVIGDSFETAALDAVLDVSRHARLNMLMGDTLDEHGGALRVKLAEGLRTVRWTARRDGESMDRIVVVWSRDLPAYVELETQTLDGRWNKWMFEVGWTQGPEPGTPQTGAPPAGADDDDADEDDEGEGPGSTPDDAADALEDAGIGIGGGK